MGIPKLTIGLPVYNKAPFLALALRSIFAQTFRDWELVIVNDGSTDSSLSILRALDHPQVTVLSDGEHKGLAARLNEIAGIARGEYLARMDADDMMHPRRLELQLAFLKRRPDIDLVGCGLLVLNREVQASGVRHFPADHKDICADALRGFHFAHPTVLGRTEWFRNHPYSVENLGCEDWQLWVTTCRESRFANLPDALYFYREYDSYSLSKYLGKKSAFAALLCSSLTADYSFRSRLHALARITGHMGGHIVAGALGLSDLVIRRRSRRVTEERDLQLARSLPGIQKVQLPTATSFVSDTNRTWEHVSLAAAD